MNFRKNLTVIYLVLFAVLVAEAAGLLVRSAVIPGLSRQAEHDRDTAMSRCNARTIASGQISLEKIYDMRYPQAKKELMKLCGVGEKVAECICLFALHHMDAFPIDTHIRQVMDVHYKRGFPNRRYRGMRGIMQQYIFYYDLYS